MDYGRYQALMKQYNETASLSIGPQETKESLINKLMDISRVKRQILAETNAIILEYITKFEKEPELLDSEAAAILDDFLSQLRPQGGDPLDPSISLRIARLLLRYYQPTQDPEQIIRLLLQCATYDLILKDHQNEYETTPYAIMAETYLGQLDRLSNRAMHMLVHCLTIGGYNRKDLAFGLKMFSEHGDAFAQIRKKVGEDDFALRYYYTLFKLNSLGYALHACLQTENAKNRVLPLSEPLIDLDKYAPLMEEFKQELENILASDEAQSLLYDRVSVRIYIALTDYHLGRIAIDELLVRLEECCRPQEDYTPYERSSALLTGWPYYLDYLCICSHHDRQYVQEKSIQIIEYVLKNADAAVKDLSEQSQYDSTAVTNRAVLQMLCTASGFLDFDYFKDTVLKTTVYANKELYVHTMMVKEIALTLLDYILDHDPKYLDGVAGFSWEYCRDHKQELMELMENCALLHDIGKFYCLDIVNNSSRALTDDEFAIIKEHPTNFSKIYQGGMDPKMACIRDCAELHHLWYNESGGYPPRAHTANKSFVNILTIADCIDAATDNIGRPYGLDKTLEQVMSEFDGARCTRYSGRISDLLHVEDIRRKIDYVIHEGRQNIYCDIYLHKN